MGKTRVSFLFGAGAEKYCFGMPSGWEYLKETFLLDDFDKYGDELRKKFSGIYFGKYTYRANKPKNGDNIYRLMLKKIIEENKNHDDETNKKSSSPTISIDGNMLSEFKSLCLENNKKYSEIKNLTLKSLLEQYAEKKFDITKDLSYVREISSAGILDSWFHTIINPAKYSEINFSKVFNYYWTCYFTIVNSIIEFLKQYSLISDELKDYLIIKNESCDLNVEKILGNIEDFTKKLYATQKEKLNSLPSSYYSEIKKIMYTEKGGNPNYELMGVFTTNYFCFPEILSDNVTYLNGKLSQFEFPELLEVRDFNKGETEENYKLFFPFIFGQSLVKPVVNEYQINAFYEFGEKLKQTDVLVILGYNINEDDNHVNAYLHKFGQSGKIFYVTDKNEKIKDDLKAKLKLNDNIEILTVQYPNDVEEQKENNELTTKIMIESIFAKLHPVQ